jgi:cell wall assembly regulator SMI1
MGHIKTISALFILTLVFACGNNKQKDSNQIDNSKKVTHQMTSIEQLKSILNEQYVSEDDDKYKVELKPGLTDQQIDKLATQLPSGQIPTDIRELLKFASGFEFLSPDEVTFDGVGQFGFENIFPYSVQLAGDGFGNFWILDVDNKGNWGNVFYVCHDPAVVVKHSENLAEFIKHIHEFGKEGLQSNLDIIHEKTVMDIWGKDNGFVEVDQARNSNDTTLKNFALQLPDNFLIADLRNKPNKTGFAWGKFGPNIDNAVRYETELLWGFEKAKKKGLLSKLFGK